MTTNCHLLHHNILYSIEALLVLYSTRRRPGVPVEGARAEVAGVEPRHQHTTPHFRGARADAFSFHPNKLAKSKSQPEEQDTALLLYYKNMRYITNQKCSDWQE